MKSLWIGFIVFWFMTIGVLGVIAVSVYLTTSVWKISAGELVPGMFLGFALLLVFAAILLAVVIRS